jgi:phosphoglycolate phosphatase
MNKYRFERLKLAFFDIDGTLVRRNFDGKLSLKSRSFNFATETVFGIKGFDYTKIMGKRIFGLTDRSILKVTLGEIGIPDADYYANEDKLFLAIDEYFDRHIDEENEAGYYALPGVREFLETLKAENIRLGMVTGNIKKHSIWKMQIGKLEGFFTTGGFGEDAELRDDIMRAGIGRNPDIPLGNICHFGDSPADIIAARECGIKCVAITDQGGGTHTSDELGEVGYGLLINSWHETDRIAEYLNRY